MPFRFCHLHSKWNLEIDKKVTETIDTNNWWNNRDMSLIFASTERLQINQVLENFIHFENYHFSQVFTYHLSLRRRLSRPTSSKLMSLRLTFYSVLALHSAYESYYHINRVSDAWTWTTDKFLLTCCSFWRARNNRCANSLDFFWCTSQIFALCSYTFTYTDAFSLGA